MTSNRLLILVVIALVAGCGDDRDGDAVEALPRTSLPGVYSGVFPCEDCAGIATTLWLRADERFFFRQRYPADDTSDEMDAYSLGLWKFVDDDRVIELVGAGPVRTFVRLDYDTLVMQTDSELEHKLTRDPAAAEFSATFRMAGIMQAGGGISFTECLTGFVAPVSKGGDFTRFRHQYRSVGGRKKPTYVEFEGRFVWSRDGALESVTIERFITVKENGSC